MRSIRRTLGAALLLGAAVGVVGGSSTASAYCGPELVSDGSSGGGNGCSNPCPDPPTILEKLGLGWHCLD